MNAILDILNEDQRNSVVSDSKNILIVAGPGTGKTRSITHRIAYLIKEQDVNPKNILAMTFTNKAAKEMKTRIQELCGDITGMRVGTYHSYCCSILRRYMDDKFSIWDESSQREAIKRIGNPWSEKETKIKNILEYISFHKRNRYDALTANQFIETLENYLRPIGYQPIIPDELLAYSTYNIKMKRHLRQIPINHYKVDDDYEYVYMYSRYESIKNNSNALDFDDLLLEAVKVLENNNRALEQQHIQYRHIIVDEYQDTDPLQYQLLNLLVNGNDIIKNDRANLCVVGDPDQSIYKFRGADYHNIMNFEKEFNADLLRLKTNYRSSQEIIDVSQESIEKNQYRIKNPLVANRGRGTEIKCDYYNSFNREIESIVGEIKKLSQDYSLNEIAVLYRFNSMGKQFEKEMLAQNIPYKMIGGTHFYERQENKYLTMWLKFLNNNSDDITFYQLLQKGSNGIGNKAAQDFADISRSDKCSIWDAMNKHGKKTRHMDKYIEQANMFMNYNGNLSNLTNMIYGSYDLPKAFREDLSRSENIEFYCHLATEYDGLDWRESIDEWLIRVGLMDDEDDNENTDNKVILSTIHKAKGLEWSCVFVPAVVDGIFPHTNDLTQEDIEESRRLYYVALTRAKDKLYISANRYMYIQRTISPFIMNDCPNTLQNQIDTINEQLLMSRNSYSKYNNYNDDDNDIPGFSPRIYSARS